MRRPDPSSLFPRPSAPDLTRGPGSPKPEPCRMLSLDFAGEAVGGGRSQMPKTVSRGRGRVGGPRCVVKSPMLCRVPMYPTPNTLCTASLQTTSDFQKSDPAQRSACVLQHAECSVKSKPKLKSPRPYVCVCVCVCVFVCLCVCRASRSLGHDSVSAGAAIASMASAGSHGNPNPEPFSPLSSTLMLELCDPLKSPLLPD
jgi:hypothetical protein